MHPSYYNIMEKLPNEAISATSINVFTNLVIQQMWLCFVPHIAFMLSCEVLQL